MELRVLRYFLAVVREGTITDAARYLHVTQPTLSRQLQDLEDELGQKLFTRSTRTISLTPEGMFLRKRAEEIMELVEKTEADFNSMDELVGGDVRIGGAETERMRLIIQVIRELQGEYPAIRYHFHSGSAADITERLDKGTLDFGLLIQPADIDKYDFINLPAADVRGILMRRDHPLARKDFITRRDLLEVPLICSRKFLQQLKSGRNDCIDWFGKDFEKLNIIAVYNLVYNATLMVEEGLGCALSLDGLVNVSGDSQLCFRPLSPPLESKLNLVWKKYQVFSKAAEIFLERVREKFMPETDHFPSAT